MVLCEDIPISVPKGCAGIYYAISSMKVRQTQAGVLFVVSVALRFKQMLQSYGMRLYL